MKKIRYQAAAIFFSLFLAFSPALSALPEQTVSITAEAKSSKSSKVYIAASGNGSCYHRNKNCSRMRGRVRKISKSSAKKQGYRACKKCY